MHCTHGNSRSNFDKWLRDHFTACASCPIAQDSESMHSVTHRHLVATKHNNHHHGAATKHDSPVVATTVEPHNVNSGTKGTARWHLGTRDAAIPEPYIRTCASPNSNQRINSSTDLQVPKPAPWGVLWKCSVLLSCSCAKGRRSRKARKSTLTPQAFQHAACTTTCQFSQALDDMMACSGRSRILDC
jgi:hypothetical protein